MFMEPEESESEKEVEETKDPDQALAREGFWAGRLKRLLGQDLPGVISVLVGYAALAQLSGDKLTVPRLVIEYVGALAVLVIGALLERYRRRARALTQREVEVGRRLSKAQMEEVEATIEPGPIQVLCRVIDRAWRQDAFWTMILTVGPAYLVANTVHVGMFYAWALGSVVAVGITALRMERATV